MSQDPIIKELRKIRQEIEAESGNDLQKYYEHLKRFQRKYQGRLVRRQPKPALKLAKAV
jgi:hypothetical protein